MVVIRRGAYAIAGQDYDFGDLWSGLLYEYRKDILSAVVATGVSFLYRHAVRPKIDTPDAKSITPLPEAAFLVPTKDGTLIVHARDIDWVEAQGNYVALYVDGTPQLIRKSLNQVEKTLDGTMFLRTHRSAIVNRSKVKGIKRDELGSLKVELVNRHMVPLSEGRRTSVLHALSKL